MESKRLKQHEVSGFMKILGNKKMLVPAKQLGEEISKFFALSEAFATATKGALTLFD